MTNNALVVVFPSVFAQNKINALISNVKKILKIQNQQFQKIRKDNSIIVVEANDPVFASSTINLLFGIEKIAIAKQVKNDYDVLVSAITKIGSNLLLKGDKFYVKIEGYSTGYLPKDLEIATSSFKTSFRSTNWWRVSAMIWSASSLQTDLSPARSLLCSM
ncbi:hypothetical protein LCGC14_2730420 [marine sediment metagenome]|uniref:THUMP domain-containing protein n=1 Tax=marine sediment metagenome TaxID=412755 RepID=A0A0F9BZ43_9ZZZZ